MVVQGGFRPYKRRNAKLKQQGFETYAEYLRSPEWAALRVKVLERDDGKCVACRSPASCVHHTKYSRKVLQATEPGDSLVSLCHGCHRRIEFSADGSKVPQSLVMDRLRRICRENGTTLPGNRCKQCMKGGGNKSDGLCKPCRRRTLAIR